MFQYICKTTKVTKLISTVKYSKLDQMKIITRTLTKDEHLAQCEKVLFSRRHKRNPHGCSTESGRAYG